MRRFCEVIQSHYITPETILEIGSRDGNDAIAIAKYFDILDNNVYVCEPNPRQAIIIKETYPNINVIQKAIFNKKGILPFMQMNGTLDEIGTSSLIPRTIDNLYAKATQINVEAITGKELLQTINRKKIVCKLDVEGATLQVLQSMKELIQNIDAFHLECEHIEVWEKQNLYNEIAKFMLQHKYEQVDFSFTISNIQSDSIWVKNNQ